MALRQPGRDGVAGGALFEESGQCRSSSVNGDEGGVYGRAELLGVRQLGEVSWRWFSSQWWFGFFVGVWVQFRR